MNPSSKTILGAMGILAVCAIPRLHAQSTTLRVNQAGYLPSDLKAAVYLGPTSSEDLRFEIVSPESGVIHPDSVVACEPWLPTPHSARIYFSALTSPGTYSLAAKDAKSGATIDVATFYVGSDAYSRLKLHELPLGYLRQQRCGYNPVHRDSCHTHDGYLVLSGERDGEHVDVTGGWHDASDYLQYLTTSANTVYRLLYAYRENPEVWADEYDAAGLPGANGIADILDEARWGLEWMIKMNPEEGMYLNQIADDRDHRYVGTPQADSTDYGFGPGKGRPVYPCSGKPYGLKGNLNRSTGEASSVAKFASSFALGADVFARTDSAFAEEMSRRARKAYAYAQAHPGACQTAPCVSPYFYEEDNWTDDMELAAASLGLLDPAHLADAANYGRLEPVTPWMGADSARHYQWYPFSNLGHVITAKNASDTLTAAEFAGYLRSGLERVARRGASNAFRHGVPFIWCSNNLCAEFVNQAMLYRELSGDRSFLEAETAARDWLFGVNPWGQTMIIMPEGSVASSPRDPHSAMTDISVKGRPGREYLTGGLVDGPVYSAIFNSLWGVRLRNDDRFKDFQGPYAVYHDDFSDYSTNEPTMDGTASLTIFLGKLAGSPKSRD